MAKDAGLYLPPRKARIRIVLPYREGRRWRFWLREVCGPGTRPEFVREPGPVWTMARNHFQAAMGAMVDEFGVITVVTDTSTLTQCTVACQQAKGGPEWCECICAGENHGGDHSGRRWTNVTGELLVNPQVYRRCFLCHREPQTRHLIFTRYAGRVPWPT